MNESFKMDNITIEIDEYGYLVNSSNHHLIKRLQEEFDELRADGDDSALYYQTNDLKTYFVFYHENAKIKVNVFDANNLSDVEKEIFIFTMYPIDTLILELEREEEV